MACTFEFSSIACLSSLIPQTGIPYQKFKFFPMSSNVTKVDEFSTNIGAVWLKLFITTFFFLFKIYFLSCPLTGCHFFRGKNNAVLPEDGKEKGFTNCAY